MLGFAGAWLSASIIVHCVSYGTKLVNSFQLSITNENPWEVYNTHSVPSLQMIVLQHFNSQELCGT